MECEFCSKIYSGRSAKANLNKHIIDGSQHYLDKKIVEIDIRRDIFLKENGWDIIRINWANYQKMTYDKKSKYITDLKKYIIELIDKKPKTHFTHKRNGYDTCICGLEKSKKSNICMRCFKKAKSNKLIFKKN